MTLPFHRAPNLERLDGIAHGFFSAQGGVSEGLYASLNGGPASKDDPAKIAENRARILAALAPNPNGATLVTLAQVHSPIVHVVGEDWDAGRHPDGDALVTRQPGLVLGIQTADCAPVLLADAQAGVIGAAHAGWKGAHGGVLEATIAAMESLGASKAHIAAAVGPCIAQANYEVDWQFRDRFLEGGLRMRKFFTLSPSKEGHYHFDLEAYVAARLESAGVTNVAKLGLCTYPPENGFFSFRRTTHRGEPDYGRQISAIVIKG